MLGKVRYLQARSDAMADLDPILGTVFQEILPLRIALMQFLGSLSAAGVRYVSVGPRVTRPGAQVRFDALFLPYCTA
jgi:hypothetical protein